jgi:hypothetical protein
MFEASVDGQPYDSERWGAYYKPYGLDVGNKSTSADADDYVPAPVAKSTAPTAPTVTESVAPFEADEVIATPTAPVKTEATKPSSQRAEDILAMIRNRKTQ